MEDVNEIEIEREGLVIGKVIVSNSDEMKIEFAPTEVNNEGPVNVQLDQDGVELLTPKRRRSKKCDVNPKNWKRPKNMNSGIKGRAYTRLKKNEKAKWEQCTRSPAKEMKPACKCKLSIKDAVGLDCQKITEEDRRKIHDKFYDMSKSEQKLYICNLVTKGLAKRSRDRIENDKTRRTFSYYYFLKVEDNKYRVCKTLFCNTFVISDWAIAKWKACQGGKISPPKGYATRGVGQTTVRSY